MNIPTQTMDLVERFEGLMLTRYYDAGGKPTIGYGHLIKPGESFNGITQEQAQELLQQDLQIAANAVTRLITIPINDNQYAALTDFCYNLGSGILQSSTLRAVINRGDFDDAPAQFERWTFCGATKLPGLIARRKAEAELFMM